MAVARDLAGGTENVIAVAGDAAFTNGISFEALNNIAEQTKRLIIVLNDNEWSIDRNVGAIAGYFHRVVTNEHYQHLHASAKKIVQKIGGQTAVKVMRRAEEAAKGMLWPSMLFEEFGLEYFGPIDGHNLPQLIETFKFLKNAERPVLLHVLTQKGRGFQPALDLQKKFHGLGPYDPETGKTSVAGLPTYSEVFANTLVELANKDERIVAITAAMPSGTGLDLFAETFPKRIFDVGIAEQHAVTFAAGLATQGMKPFAAIYSTFLQRAYDQVVHDVAIQKLPVRFPIDRAGFVGADGPTHCGAFDVGYLANLPGFVVMAASDEAELKHMVRTAADYDEGPISFRYPRGDGVGVEMPERGQFLEIGKGRVVKQGSRIALLSFGTRLQEALGAADELDAKGFSTTVADARFAKPLDMDLIKQLAGNHEMLITLEEGATGGFGAQVLHALAKLGLLDRGLKIRTLTLPDEFTEQAKPEVMYAKAGLDRKGIVATALQGIGVSADEAIRRA